MRIYSIGNKARVGFWCAAPDGETAAQIALAAGHAKRRENLDVSDVTPWYEGQMAEGVLGIREILEGDVTGRVLKRGHSRTMAQILAGEPAVAPRWLVVPCQVRR